MYNYFFKNEKKKSFHIKLYMYWLSYCTSDYIHHIPYLERIFVCVHSNEMFDNALVAIGGSQPDSHWCPCREHISASTLQKHVMCAAACCSIMVTVAYTHIVKNRKRGGKIWQLRFSKLINEWQSLGNNIFT